MGSRSDYDIVRQALETEKLFFEDKVIDIQVASAHRSPDLVKEVVETAEKDGFKVFIACAGGAAHLAGVVASFTTKPVIGVPIKTDLSGGLDSLLSMVQMPTGVPVATVAVNGIRNAVILAVQIMALSDDRLTEKLRQYKEHMVNSVQEMNDAIRHHQ